MAKAPLLKPGPWHIAQDMAAAKPFTVYRRRNGASNSSLLETLRESSGKEAQFATHAEAVQQIKTLEAAHG